MEKGRRESKKAGGTKTLPHKAPASGPRNRETERESVPTGCLAQRHANTLLLRQHHTRAQRETPVTTLLHTPHLCRYTLKQSERKNREQREREQRERKNRVQRERERKNREQRDREKEQRTENRVRERTDRERQSVHRNQLQVRITGTVLFHRG